MIALCVAFASVSAALCDVRTIPIGSLGCVSVDQSLVGNSEYEIVFDAVTLPDDGLLCTQSDI